MINYLAVLKIVKKHDKRSESPVREAVIEFTFTQVFYLALEHSYLFAECGQHLRAADRSHAASPGEEPAAAARLLCGVGADSATDFSALRRWRTSPNM